MSGGRRQAACWSQMSEFQLSFDQNLHSRCAHIPLHKRPHKVFAQLERFYRCGRQTHTCLSDPPFQLEATQTACRCTWNVHKNALSVTSSCTNLALSPPICLPSNTAHPSSRRELLLAGRCTQRVSASTGHRAFLCQALGFVCLATPARGAAHDCRAWTCHGQFGRPRGSIKSFCGELRV